jgi:hypothetical protein
VLSRRLRPAAAVPIQEEREREREREGERKRERKKGGYEGEESGSFLK